MMSMMGGFWLLLQATAFVLLLSGASCASSVAAAVAESSPHCSASSSFSHKNPIASFRGGSTAIQVAAKTDGSDDEGNKSKEDAKDGKTKKKPQRWGGFFGSSNKTTTADGDTDTDGNNKKKKDESTKPPRRRGLFGGGGQSSSKKQLNETETAPQDDKKDKKKKKQKEKETAKKTAEPEKEEKEEKKQDPAKDSTNSTATTSDSGSGIIVFGTPPPGSSPSSPSGLRVIRSAPSSPGGMMVRPSPGSPGGGMQGSPTLLLAELINSAVKLAMRLWIFAWCRKYFTDHEKIQPIQRFVWERLNDRYSKDAAVLQHVLSDPPMGVSRFWWRLLRNWRVLKERVDLPKLRMHQQFNRTVVVVPLQPDPSSDSSGGGLNLQFLRDAVSFLLQQYRAGAFGVARKDGQPLPLEVVLLVTSPGGSVGQYGLAAAQVKRLAQEGGLDLTVCVDKIAASGGFMIASQAHKIMAAPFAALGSVGVIMEGLNFRELAREYGIQPVVLKAGKYKNPTSTMFGAITNSDEKYETERLAKVHQAFQDLVIQSRPELKDKKELLEGQVFIGTEALALDLIDEVKTSDEYLLERVAAGDRVLRLHQSNQRNLQKRLYQLSPIDLLPHLRSWVIKQATPENLTSLLIAVGPALGFVNHVIRQLNKFSPQNGS